MGVHALHFNEDTIGIGLMGDYTSVAPSAAMVHALRTLLTWKCARWGINPLGSSPYVNSVGHRVTGLANICGHRDTFATVCPGNTVEAMLPRLRVQVAARVAQGALGYWIASSSGQVFAFGNLGSLGGVDATRLSAPLLGISAHPNGQGYWLCAQDGGVFTFGNAKFFGSTGGRRLNQPIVGMAATPTGKGYWLVARDGGVFCFGDAKFFGSTGSLRLNSPILGITPTSTAKGYWLYAQDGGIFAFGDAKFFGSTGGRRLNQPIVGMAARPQNDGYWMVAADGGIFGFGHAPFKGSGASRPRSAPTVSMVPSTSGNGYALLLADGSFLNFGDAPNLGGAAGPHLRSRGRDGRLPATPLARRRTWRLDRRSFVAFVLEGCRVAAASKRSNPHGYLSRQSEAPVEVARDRVPRIERGARLPPAGELRVHRGQAARAAGASPS